MLYFSFTVVTEKFQTDMSSYSPPPQDLGLLFHSGFFIHLFKIHIKVLDGKPHPESKIHSEDVCYNVM